jgi:hypothetical protein
MINVNGIERNNKSTFIFFNLIISF